MYEYFMVGLYQTLKSKLSGRWNVPDGLINAVCLHAHSDKDTQ